MLAVKRTTNFCNVSIYISKYCIDQHTKLIKKLLKINLWLFVV